MEAFGQDEDWNQNGMAPALSASFTMADLSSDRKRVAGQTSEKAKALEQAFMQMITAHEKLILSICRMYCSNRADLQDLFQEIAHELWTAYPTFEGKSKLITWVYQVSRYTANHWARKNKRIVEVRDELPDMPAQPPSDGHGDQVQQFMDALPPIDRVIIELMGNGFSRKEIATLLDMTEDGLRMRLNRLTERARMLER